jgi:hypothetical protein
MGSRPLEGVLEVVGTATDMILGWVCKWGLQWKVLRTERLKLVREAEERRVAEERAEEARWKAKEEEDAITRQE